MKANFTLAIETVSFVLQDLIVLTYMNKDHLVSLCPLSVSLCPHPPKSASNSFLTSEMGYLALFTYTW